MKLAGDDDDFDGFSSRVFVLGRDNNAAMLANRPSLTINNIDPNYSPKLRIIHFPAPGNRSLVHGASRREKCFLKFSGICRIKRSAAASLV
jgi:hypothetical protein